MGKRILLWGSVIACLVCFAGVGLLPAAGVPDKDITIKSETIEKHRKGLVSFSHEKHIKSGIGCKECHHMGPPDKKCSDCHDADKSKGKIKKLMLAFHQTCQGCHRDLNKEGKTSGPTRCDGCHK